MAIAASSVLPTNSLEDFRIEFNNLVSDVTGITSTNTFSTAIVFEGATADGYETTLTLTDPTADRTITLPNVTGNVTVSGNPVSADGEALGSASLEWSDLYIADGGVIYFGDDQEIVLTHVPDSGIRLSDSDKMLFGAGDDLQIYHDGSNSYIDDAATGTIYMRTDSTMRLKKYSADEDLATFAADGAVTLYYDNSAKLATSSAGVSVTGSMTTSGAVNPSASDGAALGSATLEWSDLFLADGAVINFGDDQDVTLTHVADAGLLLNSTMQLQFNDASQYISGASATKMDIRATDEIELTSTLVDVVGALTVSGTTTLNGALVLGDAAADTLTVNATLQGASPLTFEGGTADGYETTFAITDPTADRTITFPNLTGTVSLITATETLTNKTLTSPVLNTATVGTSIVPTSADGATLGTASVEWSDLYLADGAVIYFGDDQDVTLTHVADTGLKLKHANTGDDKYPQLTLQTGDTDIAVSDKLGAIFFQAPDEGSGTDAVLVAAGLEAISEGDFSSSNNATKLSFLTASSEAASSKMVLTSGGNLQLPTDAVVLNFGENSDVNLTHVHNTGLLLNSTSQLQFNDSSQYINAPSNAILDINATDEIELNATLMDINGNVEISGTTAQVGISTSTAKDVFNAGMSVKNGSTSAGFVEFFEDSDNGSNKATLIGPSSTADVTLTLPAVTDTVAVQSDITALAIALG